MTIPALAGTDLEIDFTAVEFRSDVDSGPYGDWALLNDEVLIHIFISILASVES
jgi:hypothetical protein